MDLVFNINRLGMLGLGATLVSLVRSCSDTASLKLNFLCSYLSRQDKANIDRLLADEGFDGQVVFIDFDARREFGHLRPLHGDWTAYGRLLIPDRIDADRALYLDADLVIELDLLALQRDVPLQGQVLAAVTDCTLEWTIDQDFLKQRIGLPKDMAYFNSGVVLFNLDECRRRNAATSWRELAQKYPDELVSHDQTVLNAYARGEFVQLPLRFNDQWPPSRRSGPSGHSDVIIHFCGSPKPWDLGGRWLHPGHDRWSRYDTPFWQAAYGGMGRDKLARFWRIRRSVLHAIKCRLAEGDRSARRLLLRR